MTPLEVQVLKSLDCQQHGRPARQPALSPAQFDAVALCLHEKGLLGVQTQTLANDWMGTTRTVVNAVWLTSAGRRVVDAMAGVSGAVEAGV
jgi:hypothetical protein